MTTTRTQQVCGGRCRRCGVDHSLPAGNAVSHARALMNELADSEKALVTPPPRDPGAPPTPRGQMFGVLECRDSSGHTVILKAFSALFGGCRNVPGWAPTMLSDEAYATIVTPGEAAIKSITADLDGLPPGCSARSRLVQARKGASNELFDTIQARYQFQNFRGETSSLSEVFNGSGRAPGGTGDCCAPKLLQEAIRRQLRPVGIAEFYWGPDNPSGSRSQGMVYPACVEKCRPILGFILCGLADLS